jgi:hypothetical protein
VYEIHDENLSLAPLAVLWLRLVLWIFCVVGFVLADQTGEVASALVFMCQDPTVNFCSGMVLMQWCQLVKNFRHGTQASFTVLRLA